MESCKVISHKMTLEYECPEFKKTYSITLNKPSIREMHYYEDEIVPYTSFHCLHCGKEHSFEI